MNGSDDPSPLLEPNSLNLWLPDDYVICLPQMIARLGMGKGSEEEELLASAWTRRLRLKPRKSIYIYGKTIKLGVVYLRA